MQTDEVFRLVIRGFKGKELMFESHLNLYASQVESLIPSLGRQHAEDMLTGRLTMVEIEFLDEPNPNERFFRIGTSPERMVLPVMIYRGGQPS